MILCLVLPIGEGKVLKPPIMYEALSVLPLLIFLMVEKAEKGMNTRWNTMKAKGDTVDLNPNISVIT